MLPECKKKSLVQEVRQESDTPECRIFFYSTIFSKKKTVSPKKLMKNCFGGTFDDFLGGGREGETRRPASKINI